ncbi:hypothetical protein Tco_0837403 [Tanacetum coccineum]
MESSYERFNSTELTDYKAKELWVELKRLFEPDENDTLWKIQRYMHNPLAWKLYDTCGVYHVSTERGHDIFMLVEKDYPLTRALMTLMLCNKLKVDEYSEMTNELLRKIFILANRPRQLASGAKISCDYEEPSDVGSLRVVVYGYGGLPMHPPSLDYVPDPKHPTSPVYVPYVPEPEYPEYLEDPEEDPEEDHVDYPADRGDGDDETSDDDDDDDDEAKDEDEEASKDEDDDEEEEEHLAPADSFVVPVVDPVPSAGDIEAFKTDESAATPPSSPRSP